jgi:hypothetical protein
VPEPVEQPPTSSPPTFTVPPAQPVNPVPPGRVTSIRLLAWLDSPPPADTLNEAR